jgi:DNA-binding LytR/AlgR family response regulator
MTKIRVLIADDEAPARNKMVRLLQNFPEVEVINVSSNGLDALENIQLLKPDVAFLDIEMPGLTGLEVAAQVPIDLPVHIVFATAYNEHAIKAFEVNAIDYLMKPFSEERLKLTFERMERKAYASNLEEVKGFSNVLANGDQSLANKIAVANGDRFKLIDPKEVIFIEVDERIPRLYTAEKSYILNLALEAIEKKLPSHQFIRISRSCIINIEEIKEIVLWFSNRYKIVMSNDKELMSSRERSKVIKSILKI